MDPADLLDLSQNLNPFAPPAEEVVARHLEAVRRYPDASEAERELAGALGADVDRVVLTNGGSEAIHLLVQEVGGSVLREPEFGLHPRGGGGPRWRSDPHSPSGRLAGSGDRADVWDEAFYALATGRWTAGRPEPVVGSLTKTFACPGLRLGYVVASDADQAERLRRRQPHWSVSALAAACLPDLLESADLPGWSAQIARARDELVRDLHARGLTVHAADAPWVLVDAPDLRARLASHGVLVRDCTSFGLAGTTRIAVPDGAGLERLVTALDSAMDNR
jgi:histidinol-phosphate/aromatic aminotransferase/cobyric acid decarboxylase-like protein